MNNVLHRKEMTHNSQQLGSDRSPPSYCEIVRSEQTLLWKEAITSVNEFSRFYCEDWTKLLHNVYQYPSILVTLRERGRIVAVLPLAVVKSPLTGTRGISLPFIDICRPYYEEPSQLEKIYEAALKLGKSERWDYLELRGDVEKITDAQSSLSFYNHVIALNENTDKIFSKFTPANQRAIRKSQNAKVKVVFSNSMESLEGFYKLQCITRKRHGLPSQPFSFFKSVHSNLIASGKGTVATAYTPEHKRAASAIYLVQGDTVHYKYGASETRYQEYRCNNAVMWAAIKHFSTKGYQLLDLGRNSIENAGLRRYKCSWGAKESIVHYHRYDLKNNVTIPMNDDVFGWHNAVFKRLPNPLLKLAGRLLYRHIA